MDQQADLLNLLTPFSPYGEAQEEALWKQSSRTTSSQALQVSSTQTQEDNGFVLLQLEKAIIWPWYNNSTLPSLFTTPELGPNLAINKCIIGKRGSSHPSPPYFHTCGDQAPGEGLSYLWRGPIHTTTKKGEVISHGQIMVEEVYLGRCTYLIP